MSLVCADYLWFERTIDVRVNIRSTRLAVRIAPSVEFH